VDVLTRLGRRRQREPSTTAAADTVAESESLAGPAATAAGLEVEFSAYAEDCRVFGFYRLLADRLTDALNGATEYELRDVLVVRNDDGLGTQALSLTVRREELLAVRASGPRGDPARRNRKRPFPVTLQTGPYVIHGYVHAVPGGDPIQQLRRSRPLVPLTESWIEYHAVGQAHRARVGTIIVNRELWDWVRLSKDDEVRLPDLPAETTPNSLAKDLTGYIRTTGD
jgi:hypothetical protein